MRAIDKIKEEYITEAELAELLNVDTKRVRDLRSNHITGKQAFIDHIKPTSKCILYHVDSVLEYLKGRHISSFGSATELEDED